VPGDAGADRGGFAIAPMVACGSRARDTLPTRNERPARPRAAEADRIERPTVRARRISRSGCGSLLAGLVGLLPKSSRMGPGGGSVPREVKGLWEQSGLRAGYSKCDGESRKIRISPRPAAGRPLPHRAPDDRRRGVGPGSRPGDGAESLWWLRPIRRGIDFPGLDLSDSHEYAHRRIPPPRRAPFLADFSDDDPPARIGAAFARGGPGPRGTSRR